jgi:hypothetical protein
MDFVRQNQKRSTAIQRSFGEGKAFSNLAVDKNQEPIAHYKTNKGRRAAIWLRLSGD